MSFYFHLLIKLGVLKKPLSVWYVYSPDLHSVCGSRFHPDIDPGFTDHIDITKACFLIQALNEASVAYHEWKSAKECRAALDYERIMLQPPRYRFIKVVSSVHSYKHRHEDVAVEKRQLCFLKF